MGYERYPRGTNPQGDYYGRQDPQDYGHDYGSGRDYSYSSARDYAATRGGGDRDAGRDRGGYGGRDYGNQRYDQRDQQYGNRSYGSAYGGDFGRGGGGSDYGRSDRYGSGYGQRGGSGEYHGSYGSDGRRFEDVGRYRNADDDNYNDPDAAYRDRQGGQSRGSGRQGYGGQPQGYQYDDRGFFQRAGDEVRSWFGDEDAERRREADQRYDERYDRERGDDRGRSSGSHRDSDYHSWRSGQIAALDRDYDEYRQENRSRFENEFSTWRTGRQGQRDQLGKVSEHMDVVGSDGEHVGTVDKVRGDRILLTKNDADAGGRHHSFASSWITSVDTKVTLNKTAAEAKKQWQDEDRNQAMFGYGDNGRQNDDTRQGDTSASSRSTSASTAKTY